MAITKKTCSVKHSWPHITWVKGPHFLTASYKEREKISYSVGPHSFSVPFGSAANKV